MENKSRFDIPALLLGILAFQVNGDNYAAAPLLVKIASDLRVDIGTAAYTVTSYMLFFGLLTVFFGPLGDRFGRLRILKIAAFGSAAFSMLSAFVSDLASLVAIRAINGAFSAGIMPLAVAYVGETSGPENRHSRIGKVMGLMFLGGATATVIGGGISWLGSWKAVYFIYGAAEFVTGVLLLLFLKPSVRGANPVVGAARSESIRAPGSVPTAGLPATRGYRAVFSDTHLMKTIGLLLFIGFSTLGSFSYLGKLVGDGSGLNLFAVGMLLSAYGLGTLAGGRVAPGLAKKKGGAFYRSAGILGGAAFLSLAFPDAVTFTAAPALFAYGFGFISLQSSIVTSAQERIPNSRGTVMSAASFAMVVSGAAGTWINGIVIGSLGYVPFVLICGLAFASAGILAPLVIGRGGLTARPESAARQAENAS